MKGKLRQMWKTENLNLHIFRWYVFLKKYRKQVKKACLVDVMAIIWTGISTVYRYLHSYMLLITSYFWCFSENFFSTADSSASYDNSTSQIRHRLQFRGVLEFWRLYQIWNRNTSVRGLFLPILQGAEREQIQFCISDLCLVRLRSVWGTSRGRTRPLLYHIVSVNFAVLILNSVQSGKTARVN